MKTSIDLHHLPIAIHIDHLNGNGFAVSRCVCFQAVFRWKIVQKSYRFLYTIFEYIMFLWIVVVYVWIVFSSTSRGVFYLFTILFCRISSRAYSLVCQFGTHGIRPTNVSKCSWCEHDIFGCFAIDDCCRSACCNATFACKSELSASLFEGSPGESCPGANPSRQRSLTMTLSKSFNAGCLSLIVDKATCVPCRSVHPIVISTERVSQHLYIGPCWLPT